MAWMKGFVGGGSVGPLVGIKFDCVASPEGDTCIWWGRGGGGGGPPMGSVSFPWAER